jgi:acyl-CoA synthetase (AMP-forming)/AMP-acid ligase II
VRAVEWDLRTPPPELERRYRTDGAWTDDTLGALLADGLSEGAGLTFKVRSQFRPYQGTFGDVADLARRTAGGLAARGVEVGDLVAFQLPNWVEAAAVFWATALLGAVPVPIVHFYGPKEVGFILRQSGAPTFITADRFGHLDYLTNLEALRADLPAIETVAVVGETPRAGLPPGTIAFTDLADAPAVTEAAPGDAAAPGLVAYTSGTTADPKGVVHAHRTISFEVRQLGAMQATGAKPNLVGAPVGHGIGMLAALLIPVYRREPINLIDVWDPRTVLAAMLEDQLLSGTGATYFLTSLLDDPDFTDAHRALMSHIGLGGAAVPAAVAERADAMGISIVRMFGSTEHPSITGASHDHPREKRLFTDGRPMPGVEIRLVDEGGNDVGTGRPGEILSRGPDCFPGYTDPKLTAGAFDADGWFATGDVGVQDEDGYVVIVDRKKDIIIRGGENVSAAEVEEQLMRVPGIAETAVVAAPDARLGEHACAFLRLQPGATAPDLDAVKDRLEHAGLARQKWPEELRVVDDFPRTPSGKIQKFALRDRLRREARG